MRAAFFICITLISIITYTLSIAETIFDDRTKSRSERIRIFVGWFGQTQSGADIVRRKGEKCSNG